MSEMDGRRCSKCGAETDAPRERTIWKFNGRGQGREDIEEHPLECYSCRPWTRYFATILTGEKEPVRFDPTMFTIDGYKP